MTYFIGVDLHKTQFTVHVRSEEKELGFTEYPTTKEGFECIKKRITNWLEAGCEVQLAVESTGNTRYFKSQIEQTGIKVVVINTSKFKVIAQSTKKTDKHDAAMISEFLQKDMLPESFMCSRESSNLKKLLNARTNLVRSIVAQKNEIHGLVLDMGILIKKGSLQSKIGRQAVLDALKSLYGDNGLETQSVKLMLTILESMEQNVKLVEKQLDALTKDDEVVKRLLTISGCGKVSAWTIRAYTDDITRFKSSKKYASYCGLVPWVQNSNEKVNHGRITKRGPKELRTAYVQIVMGIRRCKDSSEWRIIQRHERIKAMRGSGKSVISTARKLTEIVWTMLSQKEDFDKSKMLQRFQSESLREQALCMSNLVM